MIDKEYFWYLACQTCTAVLYLKASNISNKLQVLYQFIKYYFGELFIIMKKISFQHSSTEHYQTTATFILKTYSILAQPQNAQIIAWNPQGNSFTIKEIKSFVSKVLPCHFRHRKYQSFIRQLNMYNFRKLKNHQKPTFSNQFFKRDREQLLKLVHRKPEKKKRMLTDLCLQSAEILVGKPIQIEIQQDSTQIREFNLNLETNNENILAQPEQQRSRKRRVTFKEQIQQSEDENYSILMKSSTKWVNKDESCWQQIKSYQSFKISMKLLEDAEDSVHSLKCVLAQPWNQTRASCNFLQTSTLKNITQ